MKMEKVHIIATEGQNITQKISEIESEIDNLIFNLNSEFYGKAFADYGQALSEIKNNLLDSKCVLTSFSNYCENIVEMLDCTEHGSINDSDGFKI